jgi:hypothetical protein
MFSKFLCCLLALSVVCRGASASDERALQTAEEQAQLDECRESLQDLANKNPDLNRTINDLGESLFAEIFACTAEGMAGLADGGVLSCEIDGMTIENGAVFESMDAACAAAGGSIYVSSVSVQCTYPDFGFGVSMDLTNIPSCGLSEEIESVCDRELYQRLLEESYGNIEGADCTSTSTILSGGGAGDSSAGGGGGGADEEATGGDVSTGGGTSTGSANDPIDASAGGVPSSSNIIQIVLCVCGALAFFSI